jgi:hypothetical protein
MMAPTMAPMDRELRYVIDHVFLPPQVHKQKDDLTVDRSNTLLSMFLESLKSYHASLPVATFPGWKACVDMIQTMYDLQGSSLTLDVKGLLAKFDALSDGGKLMLECVE